MPSVCVYVTLPAYSVSSWKTPPCGASLAWTLSLPALVLKIITRVAPSISSLSIVAPDSWDGVKVATLLLNITVGVRTRPVFISYDQPSVLECFWGDGKRRMGTYGYHQGSQSMSNHTRPDP